MDKPKNDNSNMSRVTVTSEVKFLKLRNDDVQVRLFSKKWMGGFGYAKQEQRLIVNNKELT